MVKNEYILGLNVSGFHSSACLIRNGEILHAITEERLSRKKQDKSFPIKAIKYCCENVGIEIEDITNIYVGWNPKYYLNTSDNTLYDAFRTRGKLSYLTLNEITSNLSNEFEVKQVIQSLNREINIEYIDHHIAHASNSFIQSGFDDSDVLVLDGFGEVTTGFIGHVNDTGINASVKYETPHSMGLLYSTFTDYLGFRPNSDEWKVMALASLGNPDKYYEEVKSLIKFNGGVEFELDLSYFEFYLFFTQNYFSSKFEKLFGKTIKGGGELNQKHYDIVASLQKLVEETVLSILNSHQKTTNNKNLCISGGFFMNSVLNGKIINNTSYENLYIGGSPDDSGISIGSALYGWKYMLGKPIEKKQINHNYFGIPYTDTDILHELAKRKISYEILENPAKTAAEIIQNNEILGWFQGNSEFGQRALGNRSILANPTNPMMKDIVNSSIKYREGFRPFAPSVLSEDQESLFINCEDTLFMERVFLFKEEVRDKLPAVVHFDGTGRLHTVNKEVNEKYYNLISEFKKFSGFGVVLNTSFNINGMPLVETPSDAIDCFYQSGIDALIMNEFLIRKK
jgi:carbamoyltransferase